MRKTVTLGITAAEAPPGLLPSWIGIGTVQKSPDTGWLRVTCLLMEDNPNAYIFLNGKTVRLLKDGLEYATATTGSPDQGQAEWEMTLEDGSYTFQVVFDGDAEYSGSQSNIAPVTIYIPPPPPPISPWVYLLGGLLGLFSLYYIWKKNEKNNISTEAYS